MATTYKWKAASNANWGDAGMASTTKQDDGSAGDTSTYDNNTAGPDAPITVIADMGATISLASIDVSIGSWNSVGSAVLAGSADGSAWTTIDSGIAIGGTNSGAILTTRTQKAESGSYRYFRIVAQSQADTDDHVETRISDFRLTATAASSYVERQFPRGRQRGVWRQ